jgi:hypothetical protein
MRPVHRLFTVRLVQRIDGQKDSKAMSEYRTGQYGTGTQRFNVFGELGGF